MEAPEKEKVVLKRSILGLGNIIVREERLFEQTTDRQTDRQRERGGGDKQYKPVSYSNQSCYWLLSF